MFGAASAVHDGDADPGPGLIADSHNLERLPPWADLTFQRVLTCVFYPSA